MTRLEQTFDKLRGRREGAFVPFVMLGDPDADASLAIIDQLVNAGADMLELGLPFSDPPGDGPVIQAASERALANGMTTVKTLEIIHSIRKRHDTLPISVLCYYNVVLQYGINRFYRHAAAAGVDAVLIADVPLEEASPIIESARQHGVHPVFMVSEVTSDERIAQIAKVAEGYIYVVARVGITGEQEALASNLSEMTRRIKAHTPLPLLAGFGISSPAHAQQALASGLDGVICGSAIVRRVAEYCSSPADALSEVRQFAGQMKKATRTSAPL